MFSLDEILFDPEPHTYSYRGKQYDSVTQIIRLAGLGDDFSMVNQERMEYAQRRGRLVHLACQYYDEGDLNLATVDPAIRGYVEAYLLFREERKIKVIATEKKIVSVGLGLAGTPDLICFMAGRRCVIDRKTSQVMSKSTGIQTAGYKILWNASRRTGPIDKRFGLRLGNDGTYKLIEHNDPDDHVAFWDCLKHSRTEKPMARWREKYGKQIKA